MTKLEAKKTVKDSVFRDLFEKPEYLLQLYQALHPEDTKTTVEQLGIVTIQNILIDQVYNDLGFTVRDKLLVLVEAQSSWSENIIVRILIYLAETWKEYIQNTKQNVYGSKKLNLPEPELYVIYTGDRKSRKKWLSLSEAFFDGHKGQVEVKVRVLYDGQKGDLLNQYVTFTKVYQQQSSKYGRTRKAVLETIKICKDRNVLKEYLEEREKEVVDIMMTLFDQEYAVERFGDDKKEEGKLEEKKDIALNLAKMGMAIENIAEAVQVSVKMVQKWISGMTKAQS